MVKRVNSLPAEDAEFQMFVLDELGEELERQGKDVLYLTIGIPELETPKAVVDTIVDALRDPVRVRQVYPEGLPEFREALAAHYRTRFGADVDAAHVIVNTGTSPIFRNLFQVLAAGGLEVLLPRPYYSLYLISAKLAGATIRFYDIDPATLRLDIDSFRRNFDRDRTAVVVINSPGNPLGNVLNREEIEAIYDIVDHSAYVINDEIYNNCVFYEDYLCPLAILPEHRDVTIVTNSFSKGYRMYTKRVGFAFLPDELMMPMRIIQQHTLLTSDPCYQYGMMEALKDEESPATLRDIYKARAEYTTQRLAGSPANPRRSEGGFYAILDCSADYLASKGFASSKDLARDILEKVHVATVPGTDFGMPDGLRLAFCEARYNEGIDRLRDYFSG